MSPVDLLHRLQVGVGERYRLVREVGRGGMAVVYLADDLKHGRPVALKVLRPEVAGVLGAERFLQEIRIAARLQHQYILGLHDSGEVDGVLYYTMPFVEGESLRERLARERQLALPEALRIAGEVAEALEYAHRQGVVHRDVKPGNILLVGAHALVADFGVAKALVAAGGEELTSSGLAVGTPSYMSPEQASGDTRIDGRADIYALGCVLYEMLAGEPPFAGRTPQAVLARHLHEPPPSLRVVRPNTPPLVEELIERALAKVPADRFATAEEFRGALQSAMQGQKPAHRRRPWTRRWTVAAIAACVSGVLAFAAWQAVAPQRVRLDSTRVVVFPLRDTSPEGAGEGVATYIGYALEGASPLRWLEGWDWLSEAQRSGSGAIPTEVAARISRAQRARYYIDGLIVRVVDSVTVVLRLHDVQGDSVVRSAGASASGTEAAIPHLGLEAVGRLLPALLEPGRRVDLSPLEHRSPAAVAAFLQGEREYRRMRLAGALQRYRQAVAADSALALAAIKGAQAANWRELNDEALRLVEVALRADRGLPPRYQRFARGLKSYLTGAGDSAVAQFRDALRHEPSWSEGWMALGETYYHLLPRAASPDSLAEVAFLEARRADSAFTPPLFHLAEFALRRADTSAATTLIREFQAAESDSLLGSQLELMLHCVREGPSRLDWARSVSLGIENVLRASRLLSIGGAQAACARAGFRAVLQAGAATPNQRWASLLGLQALFAAQGRLDSLQSLLDSKAATELGGPVLYLVAADALGSGLDQRAAEVARGFGTDYPSLVTPIVWALGTWAAHRGMRDALEAIAATMRARADTSRARVDSLVADAMAAHALLARGDSSGARTRFLALSPTAPLGDLEWQPWESLAGERLTLAELLLAQGEYARADQVAGQLQAPQPLIYLTYLPAAFALRTKAAVALGQGHSADQLRARSAALRQGLPAVVPVVPPAE